MCAILVVLSTTARGDPAATQPAHLRSRIGWVCAYWTERIRADVNGDGRFDGILSYVRAAPHGTCDETDLPPRWRVELSMGVTARIDRPIRCAASSAICHVGVADLNGDGVAELIVHWDGGAAVDDASVFRPVGGSLRRLRTPSGGPFSLTFASGSSFRRGWGCRTRSNGHRVLLSYRGGPEGSPDGPWRFVVQRWRYDGVAVRRLGAHERLMRNPGGQWPAPRVERCATPSPS